MKNIARRLLVTSIGVGVLFAFVDIVSAANLSSGLQEGSGDIQVPSWLYLTTGGAAVGASGMLAMFVTDRRLIESIHQASYTVTIRETLHRWGRIIIGTLTVVGLGLVIYTGLTGPRIANANLAILVVFAGCRAGLVMMTYLVGNIWPALNPWRTLSTFLPSRDADYPEQWGVWPAVGGLLVLLWVEIVAAPAQFSRTLVIIVLAYSMYTLLGAVIFSPTDWFHYADPVAVLFRYYGAVAPIQRASSGISIKLPGAKLRKSEVIDGVSGVAFVLLLVWELTYSAFLVTPPGITTVEFIVDLGIPPVGTYLALLLLGYGFFVGSYWLATTYAKRIAETYVTTEFLVIRFAPPLLGIAAGYHLAHYFSFFVSLSPSLVLTVMDPLSPPVPPLTLGLPNWVGLLNIGFILVGHLLAIWAAHATSFAVFPSRLQAIRSQYPLIIVMIVYTMISLWLISLPTTNPAFVG